MTKEFIPYEQALVLNELGFNETCFGYYDHQIKELDTISSEVCERLCKHDTYIKAPTFSQAFRFFREKYSLLHEITSVQKDSWLITVDDMSSTTKNGVYNGKRWDCDDLDDDIPHTYEEAELACLKKLIEIIKK